MKLNCRALTWKYGTKQEQLKIELCYPGEGLVELLTPEEAVAFGTKLINLAYPLTKAVQKRTLPEKPNEYQGGFCSHYKSGRR